MRVAQVQSVLGGALALELSSGARPSAARADVLDIAPPFRLALVAAGRARATLVDAPDDASFRKLNNRDAEAQAAPRNRYSQLYLETSGAPGDLRISRVTAGDPAIVGATFVHERLP